MEHEFTKHRRSPRVSTENRTMAALHVSVPVRLLDLSSDGMLLACEVPLRAGSTVRVVTGLAGRRLEVELSVDEVSNRPDERIGGYVLAGSFPSFDPAARQIITALLGASGLCAAAEPVPQAAHRRPQTPVHSRVRRERPGRRPEQPRPDQASWSAPAQ